MGARLARSDRDDFGHIMVNGSAPPHLVTRPPTSPTGCSARPGTRRPDSVGPRQKQRLPAGRSSGRRTRHLRRRRTTHRIVSGSALGARYPLSATSAVESFGLGCEGGTARPSCRNGRVAQRHASPPSAQRPGQQRRRRMAGISQPRPSGRRGLWKTQDQHGLYDVAGRKHRGDGPRGRSSAGPAGAGTQRQPPGSPPECHVLLREPAVCHT